MDLLYIAVIAVVLAVDAFVVSISCGMSHSRIDWKFYAKVPSFFGIAQAIFFAGGIFFGFLIEKIIESAAPWIAFILLSFVGIKLILEAIRGWKNPKECRIVSTKTLILLSVATSIDALAIGITFPLLDIPALIPIIVVGSVTSGFSFIGILIGDALKGKFDKIAEIAAGLFLIGLGVKVLMDHIL
jgi:putative Mn2+ efflux pump MntP